MPMSATATAARTARLLLWLSLATIATVMLAGATAASAASSPKAARVVSHTHDPGGQTPSNVVCPDRQGVAGNALDGVNNLGLLASDTYRGTSRYWVCLYPQPDGSLIHFGVSTDTVSVSGCGRGSLQYVFKGTTSAPDPLTATRTTHSDWTIIKGSGTGGLQGVTGQGTSDGTVSLAFEEDALFRGTVYC